MEKGASKEKIGLRGAMPPGVLFAVYDSETGIPEYIPPDYTDIPGLLDELVEYVNTTDDHPLIIAELYLGKVCELSKAAEKDNLAGSLSYLNAKEKELLSFLLKKHMYEFARSNEKKLLKKLLS